MNSFLHLVFCLPFVVNSYSITSPALEVLWTQGETHTITWDVGFSTGSSVKIELWDSNGVDELVQSIIASTPNDGSFSWDIPVTLSGTPDDRRLQFIFIKEISCSFCSDLSSSSFTLARSNGVIDNVCLFSSPF